MKKAFFEHGTKLYSKEDRYSHGNTRYMGLYVAEDTKDFFKGEPYADCTVNLPGLQEDEFALDHNFRDLSTRELLEQVFEYLAGVPYPGEPVRYIQSGYVTFPVYKLAKERI